MVPAADQHLLVAGQVRMDVEEEDAAVAAVLLREGGQVEEEDEEGDDEVMLEDSREKTVVTPEPVVKITVEKSADDE